MGFGVPRSDCDRVLQGLAGIVPLLLLAVRVSEIVESDQVIRDQRERLLKVWDGFSSAPSRVARSPRLFQALASVPG